MQWKVHTSQLERGIYRTVLQGIHTPFLQLARTWRQLSSQIEAEIPRGTALLSFAAAPDVRLGFRGRTLHPREVVFQRDSSLLEASLSSASDIMTLCVDAEELDCRARHLWHRPFQADTGTLAFENAEGARRTSACFLRTIRENLVDGGPLTDPAIARIFENRILDGILCSLKDRTPATGTLGRNATARRAAGILRERCAEDISITDLCAATGATRRTLHLGFMELYGVPPMRYLKALRLCKVRRELSKMMDREVRVTDVAMRWGFLHLGRFASDYRQFFGELPSVQKARANPHPSHCRAYR